MSFFSQHKLIAAVLIIVVLIGAWYTLSGSPSTPAPALTTTPVAGTDTADQTLVATLLQLRSVTLNDTIFSDPAFLALQDFSTPIVNEPVGRPNPFAPLSASAGVVSASSTQNAQLFTPRK